MTKTFSMSTRGRWLAAMVLTCSPVLGCASEAYDASDELRAVPQVQELGATHVIGRIPCLGGVTYNTTTAFFTCSGGEFCSDSDDAIVAMSLADGTKKPIMQGCRWFGGSTTSGSTLLFQDFDEDSIRSVASSGTPGETFVTATVGAVFHPGILSDSARVYWSDYNGVHAKTIVNGNAATTLVASNAAQLVANVAGYIYYKVNASIPVPGGLTRDVTELRRIPVAGGASELLHTTLRGSIGLVADLNYIYIVSNVYMGDRVREVVAEIRRMPINSNVSESIYTVRGSNITSLAVSAVTFLGGSSNLYWLEKSDTSRYARLMRRSNPATAGDVTVQMDSLDEPWGLHIVRNRTIYWISKQSGVIELRSASLP